MKTLKDIREDIANVSAGIGVRGFGDVTGTPKVGEEDDQDNPHIQRVMQGAEENNSAVDQFIKNNTDGIYTWEGGFDWWADRKGMAKYTKFKSAAPLGFAPLKSKNLQEGLEKDHYKAIDDVHVNLENRNHAIDEYGYGPMNPNEDSTDFWKQKAKLWKNTVEEAKKSRCGNCAAFNQSKEIIKRIADALGPAGEKITEMSGLGYCEMFHFKCAASRTCDAWLVNGPIKEEIGGGVAAPGGNTTGWGYVAGAGAHLEGKPSNWAEPGVKPEDQKKKKKKKKTDDPRMFAMFRRKAVSMFGTGLKEIPIQEEVKTGMFAGEQTFIVPSHVFEKAMHAKRKHKHWRTYINDEMFHPAIREYANKNLKCPVIIEDEKTGYMCYARYGRKKR